MPKTTYTYANITVPNGGNFSNVTLTGTTGLTYSTTATSWGSPKVKITDSDIELDGLSLKATLQAVNERLAIMVPNPRLETDFAELRELADRYRELEQKLLDQTKMWDTLKKTDK